MVGWVGNCHGLVLSGVVDSASISIAKGLGDGMVRHKRILRTSK